MTGKKNNKSKKNGILKFFGGVKAEVKKITWPTKIEAKKALVALAVVAGIYLILVGGLDFIFQNLFEVILNLK
ncbi:preprotein translocase subunit SecE [Clostridium sp. MSJ-8]|uniref:preprotein translocase subunit SecE n=1 Tax=Clostridium sp. MSJ-8 TaxID=2841510 RepID=UPI001C0F1BFC|nr:preprotein translocase subunit SecE [Clostridium sp. MSJ-8]MBU5487230.1 preprotein translocase subunit SecE [Clostridium sp. MSJ-8]